MDLLVRCWKKKVLVSVRKWRYELAIVFSWYWTLYLTNSIGFSQTETHFRSVSLETPASALCLWATLENYFSYAAISLTVKESSLCYLYVIVKGPVSLYNWKLVCYSFFLNGTSGFFSLSQRTRLGISHPCRYTLRATSIFAASLMAPGRFVLTWGKNQEYQCSQRMSLSFLSNCFSLCMSVVHPAEIRSTNHTRPPARNQTKWGHGKEKALSWPAELFSMAQYMLCYDS